MKACSSYPLTMVGFQAFISQFLVLAIPGFILVLLLALAIRQRNTWRSKPLVQRFLETAVLLVVAGLTILASERVFRQYQAHRTLRTLRPELVTSIRVENSVISDRQQLTEIVQALNGEQWFSSSHGGWARRVSLVLTLNDGRQITYQVAAYLKEEGAVIIFDPDGSGYAFSRALRSVLNRARIQLPMESP